MYYLDNAATSFPKPPSVLRALIRAEREFGGNPGRGGHRFAGRAEAAVYGVREKAAAFFGAEPENVIFTLNATHALNMAIFSLARAAADVVTSDMEHNAVRRPLYALRERGVRRVMFSVADDDAETVAAFQNALTERTALVCVTAASNVTGRILPIAAIGGLCKKRGIPLVVDASQAAGLVPLTLASSGADIICAPAHKGLYGVRGCGLMICAKNRQIRPLLFGGSGISSLNAEMPAALPERLEAGTLPVPAILALGAGFDFLAATTSSALLERERALAGLAREYLAEIPGIELIGKSDSGTFSFRLKGHSSVQTAELLNAAGFALRGGLHCAPDAHRKLGTLDTGTVRFSAGAFNRADEIKKFAKVLKKFANTVCLSR